MTSFDEYIPKESEFSTLPSLSGPQCPSSPPVPKALSPKGSKVTNVPNGFASASRVEDLQQAVKLSLSEPIGGKRLFVFARALMAMEETTGIELGEADLGSAFSLWWARAQSTLAPGTLFDETEWDFRRAWKCAKVPLGVSTLAHAIELAETSEPECANQFTGRARKLVAVCWHLQRINGDSFYLSVREAAKIVGNKKQYAGAAVLDFLESKGVIEVLEKGTAKGRRATRFRFLKDL